jgi:iron complex outermembrane receptor protein
MKPPLRLSIALLVGLSAFAGRTFAQAPATPGDSAKPDDVVILSAFDVSASGATRYESDEATSATRVRTNIFDTSSTVTVLTQAFLQDTQPTNVIDALKYVAGLAESTQPVGGDRMSIRGFQTDGQILDGFLRTGPYNHLDDYIIDHVEVVMGPNAILNPSGQAGGSVNYVSKKADFLTQSSFTVQAGQYDANKVMFDIDRPVSNDVAIRVVGDITDATGYYHDTDHSWSVLPSATFRIGDRNSVTIEGFFEVTHRTFVGGVPISPLASDTNITTQLWPGVARNADPYTSTNNPRDETGQHYQLFYTGSLNDNFSWRVAAHLLEGTHHEIQFTNSPQNVNGLAVTGAADINPYTGAYDPTTLYGGAPNFTATPAPTPNGIFNRTASTSAYTEAQYDLQNDYVYDLKLNGVHTTTTAGYFLTHDTFTYESDNLSLPAFNIDGPYVYQPYANLGISNLGKQTTSISEEYVHENLEFFDKKLILSGGLSDNEYHSKIVSISKNGTNASTTPKVFKSAGAVVEPIDVLSFYYGFSQSALLNPPDVGVTTSPLQVGQDQEVGARYKFLGGRGTASVDYFFITQNNVQVPNPGNLLYPAPVPPLPPLASNRVARGWEYSTNFALTDEFSLLGNFTDFKNRDFYGAPIRGTAEKSGAVWIDYTASAKSMLNGFGVGLGVSYLSKRAGDTETGYAPASALTSTPVLNQPTFWLPSYYRVDLSLSYRFTRNWQARAFIENLLDADYLAGSLNRNSVVVGLPTNVKGSVTYSF